jgi:macrolide transport system ATP-binding/permease protein
MPDPIIRVENVTRVYHVGDVDVHALRGVSLKVQRGEFIAIMGSSGSGKSTLMALLGCLDRPSSGYYYFEGVNVARLNEPELARIRGERLGFVFQSFNLLARTSAIENVALPLFYATTNRSGRTSRLERASEALALVGLRDRGRNTPGQLSGGQQQRVAIARALINNPGLLLADEPTGNLDTRTSYDIMQTLQSLNREQGVTIIVVTHEPDIAAYADRVITMRDGTIISDVCKRPAASPQSAATAAGVPPDRQPPAPAEAAGGAVWAFATMIMAAAMQALARNKMRSALTMLGVFIGVAALIAMIAVGQANEAVRKQIESLGTNLLVVVPGATTMGGIRGGLGSASTLTIDVEALRREAPAVGSVSYLIRQLGQVQYANQNWSTSIQGVSANYPPITNWQILAGRGIAQMDDDSAALVVVLGQAERRLRTTVREMTPPNWGQSLVRQLFGANENPVGAVIQVKSMPLRVIGILAPRGQTPYGTDQDDFVMIPFTTAERKVLGVAAPSQQQVPINWAYPPPPNPYRRCQRFLRPQSQPDRGNGREQQPHHGAPTCRSPRFHSLSVASGS